MSEQNQTAASPLTETEKECEEFRKKVNKLKFFKNKNKTKTNLIWLIKKVDENLKTFSKIDSKSKGKDKVAYKEALEEAINQ